MSVVSNLQLVISRPTGFARGCFSGFPESSPTRIPQTGNSVDPCYYERRKTYLKQNELSGLLVSCNISLLSCVYDSRYLDQGPVSLVTVMTLYGVSRLQQLQQEGQHPHQDRHPHCCFSVQCPVSSLHCPALQCPVKWQPPSPQGASLGPPLTYIKTFLSLFSASRVRMVIGQHCTLL